MARYRNVHFGRNVELHGRVWNHGDGKVEIGDHARIDAAERPVSLHAEQDVEIVTGDGADVGGTSIEATARVLIGDGARIGRLCKVLDNSFHDARGGWNQPPPSQPVEIGAGARIGDRAILLPGANVKPSHIVEPGVVVRSPRYVAGNAATPRASVTAKLPDHTSSRLA